MVIYKIYIESVVIPFASHEVQFFSYMYGLRRKSLEPIGVGYAFDFSDFSHPRVFAL